MPSLVVVGAQWGDEGKGKIVDFLTAQADLVVRFQGGNNAGHTLVVQGRTTKLHLVPSGILRPGARCAIGAGVVVDPFVLEGELRSLLESGIDVTPERLVIDWHAPLILPYHVARDRAREQARGDNKIGTTGRGVGPAYEDRAARCAVRVTDLVHEAGLKTLLEENVRTSNLMLKHLYGSSEAIDARALYDTLMPVAQRMLRYAGDVSREVALAYEQGARIVYEGAQGSLLDPSFGTVPFVTSASTLAGAATTGIGIGPRLIDYSLGVAKAYTTRVGGGPFPTELNDETGGLIRERGHEYGTTTGRPRRCGWLDAVALQEAVRLNGLEGLVITKLDVLSGLEKVKLCVGYTVDGRMVDGVPPSVAEFCSVRPVYEEFAGWGELPQSARALRDLPDSLGNFLKRVEQLVRCPVVVTSISPEREGTIFMPGSEFVRAFAGAVP